MPRRRAPRPLQEGRRLTAQPDAPLRSIARPLVLLAEDHADTRAMYAAYLRFDGWAVSTAPDGGAAIARARALLPQLIVLDLMMPRIDGWEALRQLKADPRTAAIPIIVITGHDWKEHLRTATIAEGAVSYLTKPCLPSTLAREAHRIVGPLPVRRASKG